MGGSEVEAQRVSAALIQRGHQVQILCSGGPPMPPVRDWIDPAGVPVRILTRRSRGRWKNFVFAWEVARGIWRGRKTFDVVYFLMQGLHLAAGLPVARLSAKPIVMKISGSGIIQLMRSSWIGGLELDWLRRWAAAIMILNDGMIDEAVADGFSREQLTWMPNPVDVAEFRPPEASSGGADERSRLRTRFAIPAAARVVIYVGRLSHEKGLTGLLGGFAHAAREAPESSLLLVGDGPQRAELEAIARQLQLGPEKIRFVGRVDAAEVPLWLRAGDVFALTSPSEGFSCALVEAMASGLPSVVSAIPANLQLVDEGLHGLTVPFDDERAIGKAVVQLVRNPELALRMGMAARQRAVENYSTLRVVERYETLFQKAIRQKP